MKVLLVGSGGREHALGWKIAQSPRLSKLYLVPGNPGLKALGETLPTPAHDIDAITAIAEEKSVDLVVVGPEAPLAAGLADQLHNRNIACFGPTSAATQLESSKGFMKDLCKAANIPTARYARFTAPQAAIAYLQDMTPPYVVKADGLAAGKGVVIAETHQDAVNAIKNMFDGQFGDAGQNIVIEEFLDGEEASFFVIADGVTALPLAAAQDHKRAFDGDKGPNTGGMGAYSPTPVFTPEIQLEVMQTIIEPTLHAMADAGTPFQGVLFAGLMITKDGPKLIEYNVRFGDPECQILMRRLKSDLLPVLYAAATGTLSSQTLDWSNDAAALIVMAANGYPGSYKKGSPIAGLEDAALLDGVEIFQAGTKDVDGQLLANGGRVLNITAIGPSINQALDRAYKAVEKIDWPDGFYRTDIGWRVREQANESC